jgi:hypothetical protein
MGGEVLDVRLPAASGCGEFFQEKSALLDHQPRLAADHRSSISVS